MKYEILNAAGEVVNTIVATPEFVEFAHPGLYREIADPVDATAAQAEAIAKVEAQRAEAYRKESDPLFFKSQRGEATHQQWLDKVAEIRARYPLA